MTYAAKLAPPEPFSALIFDCDGTLADTMPTHYRAWSAALSALGAEFKESQFYAMGGMPTATIIQALNDEYGYTLEVESTHHDKEQRYLTLLHQVTEIKAVADIARAYHGKVPMAVASGGARHVVEATLEAVGLTGLFDVIVTADDVVNGKPDPEVFLKAAERLGVAPADCIIYEDGEVGLEAARVAGIRAIDVRVLWDGHPSEESQRIALERLSGA